MGKYKPLYFYLQYLTAREENVWDVTFEQIETVLGFNLPESATHYPAWWANEQSGAHVQKAAWLDAGWKTQKLNLAERTVTFSRNVV